jgi:hypothetical protein
MKKVLDTENLVNFTNKDDILFVPCDGEIKVYNKAILLETIPLSVCTKFTSLYFTNAGIVVYENNKLYLINKK